jgi:hypothetical protein
LKLSKQSYYSQNRLNDNLIKLFVIEYIKMNFKKGPEKTNKLLIMLQSLAYLHPNENKRRKLIEFRERFELNNDTLKNWVYAFLLLLKSK